MKKFLILLFAVTLVTSLSSCKKCKGEDPRARIVNNGTATVSVHIETSGGNTVNINNIDPGQVSDWASYAPGAVDFTISSGPGVSVTIGVTMEECWEYDITIASDNSISSVPHDRNE